MKVWSKGLGSNVLNIDPAKLRFRYERGRLILEGKMGPPTYWDFWVRIHLEDLTQLIQLILRRNSLKAMLKYAAELIIAPFKVFSGILP